MGKNVKVEEDQFPATRQPTGFGIQGLMLGAWGLRALGLWSDITIAAGGCSQAVLEAFGEGTLMAWAYLGGLCLGIRPTSLLPYTGAAQPLEAYPCDYLSFMASVP